MEWGLGRLADILGKYDYQALDLLSCMTLDVENCHDTVHSKEVHVSARICQVVWCKNEGERQTCYELGCIPCITPVEGPGTQSNITIKKKLLRADPWCRSVIKNLFMLLAVRISSYGRTRVVWRALKKVELHSAVASCNSYASFVLSKLPACIHNSIYAR